MEIKDLKSLNEKLKQCALPQLTKSELDELLKISTRESVIKALSRFFDDGDAGAQSWLGVRIKEAKMAADAAAANKNGTAAAQSPTGQAGASGTGGQQKTSGAGAGSSNGKPPHQDGGMTSSGGASSSISQEGGGENSEGVPTEFAREQVKVFGSKGALNFETDSTKKDCPTISIEAAKAIETRKFDWSSKIRVQLTKAELPQMLGVLIGEAQSVTFKNHGANKTKSISIEHQPEFGHFLVRVSEKDKDMVVVPVPVAEAFYVSALFMVQIRRATDLTDTGVIALVARMAKLGQKKAQTK